MSNNYLMEYMRRLGWGSGFQLPISNEENRELERQLEAKQRKVLELRISVEEQNQRVEDLKNQMTRTSVLITNVGNMGQIQKSTLEHTRSLNAAANNGLRNILREVKEKSKELDEKRIRHGNTRTELETRQGLVNHLSSEVEFDQTAIAAVRNSYTDEENDIELMAKYFDMDASVIKEKEFEYEKVKDKAVKLKSQLDNIMSQMKHSELVANRVCHQFREVYKSRNDAVGLWKGVIESLKMRDVDLQAMAEEYVDLQKNLTNKGLLVKEKQSLLTSTQTNSTELDSRRLALDKLIFELRNQISNNKSNIRDFISQMKTIRLEVQALSIGAHKIQNKRSKTSEEYITIVDKENQIRAEVDVVRLQHKNFKYGSASTDEKFKQLTTTLDYEELFLQMKQKESMKNRGILLLSTNENKDMKRQLHALALDIRGKQNQFKCLFNLTRNNLFKHGKNKQIMYELQIATVSLMEQIKRQISKNEREDEIKKISPVGIDRMRLELQEVIGDKLRNTNLTSFTESVLNRIRKEVMDFTELGLIIQNENENAIILANSYERAGLHITKLLKEHKFEATMIFLTLNRQKGALKERKHKIYSAEKNQLKLRAAMGERRSDIQSLILLLEQNKKLLVDNRTKLMLHLNEAQSFIRTWKTKYEFSMASMADGSDSEPGGRSEAYFIVKFSQEKECLKREGETWDQQVKDAEMEVQGLQNTLALMSSSNCAFKTSLTPAWKSSQVSEKALVTKNLIRDSMVLKRKTEKHLEQLLKTVNEKEIEIQEVKLATKLLGETLGDRRRELSTVLHEISIQKGKIDRATLIGRRIMKQMDQSSHAERNLIEADIKLRCLKEKYEFSVKTLQKAISTFPILHPWILNYFKTHKIFHKLAERLQKHEFLASIATSASQVPMIGSKTSQSLPLSRPMSVSNQQKIQNELKAEQIRSKHRKFQSLPPKFLENLLDANKKAEKEARLALEAEKME